MAETIVITHDWKCDCGSNRFTEAGHCFYVCLECNAEYSSNKPWTDPPQEQHVNDRLDKPLDRLIGKLAMESLELLEAEVAQLREEKAALLEALKLLSAWFGDINGIACKAIQKAEKGTIL